MPKYSRTIKYQGIRDQIAADNEQQLNMEVTKLKPYSDRLKAIDTEILQQSQTAIKTIDSALARINTQRVSDSAAEKNNPSENEYHEDSETKEPVISNHFDTVLPISIKPLSESEQSEQKSTAQTSEVLSSSHNSDLLPFGKLRTSEVDDKKSHTARDFKFEIEQLLNNNKETNAPRVYSEGVTDSLILETQELRREISEQQDIIFTFENKIKNTHNVINIMLWIIILSLSVIFISVLYFILG